MIPATRRGPELFDTNCWKAILPTSGRIVFYGEELKKTNWIKEGF